MRKFLFTLVVLCIMGLQSVVAQSYEVVYSMKMDAGAIVNMLSSETGMPSDMMTFLKNDIKKAKLMVSLHVSRDKSLMMFLKDRSKFEINMMGMKMDGAAMFDNMGINSYADYAGRVSYTISHLNGKTYMVKDDEMSALNFTKTNDKKTILGHECHKMVDKDNGSVVWYAADIPFQTKMYPGVPGLVLEMSEDTGGFTFTAASYKASGKPVALPKNAKKVTQAQVDKMIESMH